MNAYTRILAAAAVLCIAPLNLAGAQSIRVIVNGEPVRFETTGAIERDGRVLVPLRGVLEKMGAYVEWRESTRTAIASKENMTIELPIGSRWAIVNGDRVRLDVPAMTYFGSTMVPLRFLSESLGADVDWNAVAYTVEIVSDRVAANPSGYAYRRGRAYRERPERIRPGAIQPEVFSVSTDFTGTYLRPDERMRIKMRATPGGTAYFRIRGVVGERKMVEISPGIYEGTWVNRTDMDQRIEPSEILCFVVIGDIATNEAHP